MKTTTFLTVLLALFFNFTSFAGNGERLLKKKIHSQIKYPELKSGEKVETEVYVQLSVNDLGELVIASIESANPEVTDAIRQQLRKISIAPDAELTGKTFYYKFLLKVQ